MATFNDAMQLKAIWWMECSAELFKKQYNTWWHKHLLANSYIKLTLESCCFEQRDSGAVDDFRQVWSVTTERQFQFFNYWHTQTSAITQQNAMLWGVSSSRRCLTEPQSRGTGLWVGHIYCNVCCLNYNYTVYIHYRSKVWNKVWFLMLTKAAFI